MTRRLLEASLLLVAAIIIALLIVALTNTGGGSSGIAARRAEQVFRRNDTLWVCDHGCLYVPTSWTRCTPPKTKR